MTDRYIIRTSERLAFKRCRRQWDYSSDNRQGLEPIRNAVALNFGTAVHAAMAVYYDPKTWGDDVRVETITAFDLSILSMKGDVPDDKYQELKDLGRGMLKYYFMWAPRYDRGQPILVEQEFEVPIPDPYGLSDQLYWEGIPVFYQGRFDKLEVDDGEYWLDDYKTCVSFCDPEILELDEQCKSYAWAAQLQLGIPIVGIKYTELRKSVPHPPKELVRGGLSVAKNQLTTFELFVATARRLGYPLEPYLDYLDFLKESPKQFVRRSRNHYSQKELENQGIQIGLEAIDMLNDPSIYPSPNRMECQRCAFRTPCLAENDGSDVEWILNDSYQKRKEPRNLILVDDDDFEYDSL